MNPNFLKYCILFFFTCSHFLIFSQIKNQPALVDLTSLTDDFSYEIRYATTKNFIGEKLYDCAKCLLQPEVAKAIIVANDYFCQLGFRIKIYDCYRPLDVQKMMWKKVPRPTYVANPYTKGSMHNRGVAVDLTLETLDGCPVDMGTDYDFLGRQSHIDFKNLPSHVLKNRKILQEGMKKFGFKGIRTEWWHFSYVKSRKFPVLNIPFNCN